MRRDAPCDFTVIDVDAAFRQVTNPSLWIVALIQPKVVYIWVFISHLKVSDNTVSLKTQFDKVTR